MILPSVISIVSFGLVNLVAVSITYNRTNRTKNVKPQKEDMALKSMVAIAISLIMLFTPLYIVEYRLHECLLSNDFILYILMCLFGIMTKLLCKFIFTSMDRHKRENYDEELSVILLIACIVLSILFLIVNGNKYFWFYLSVAVGRFLWLDSNCQTLKESFCLFRQLSCASWYGIFVAIMLIVAALLEEAFTVQIWFPVIGIILSITGYSFWKHSPIKSNGKSPVNH